MEVLCNVMRPCDLMGPQRFNGTRRVCDAIEPLESVRALALLAYDAS